MPLNPGACAYPASDTALPGDDGNLNFNDGNYETALEHLLHLFKNERQYYERDLARMQTEFQEDLNLRQNEEYGQLQRAMLKEVQDFAQQQGYDLIVGDGVLYVNSAVNITDEVLRAVEANYQAASAR